MTYDEVSVGAAVSVDARWVLRRAAGAGGAKPEAIPITRVASAARRLTMLSQR